MIKNLKIPLLLTIMFLIMGQPGACEKLLRKADTLFAAQRFSAAADLYKQSLDQEKKTSKSDLLKLAFIEEGRDDDVMSIYYLHQFYL